jgi:DNA-binding CsgD family transcriptional regulator
MKLPLTQKQPSLLSYVKNVSADTSTDETIATYLKHLHALNTGSQYLFSHSVPMVFLLDYTTGEYLHMSNSAKSVLGFESKEFINCGLGFTLDNYEKSQFRVYNNEIFPDRLALLKSIPPEKHCQYVFTHNLQLRNRSSEYASLLQRNVFIKSDSNGKPLLTLGIVINISPFHSNNPVFQTVEKIDPENPSSGSEVIFKRSYYLNNEDKLFSNREKQVLFWLAEGLTSKQISDKLFISESTVIVHRRNMLERTGLPNVASLVSFGIRNQVI